MEYHIDNRVVLSTEREHKSLYSWSIKEFDENGKQIGGDQIPWEWGLNFEVVELTSTYGVEIKAGGDMLDEENSRNQTVEIAEALHGKLRPSMEMRKAGLYSLFGTQRRIEHFGLFIYKAAGDVRESCRLWGSPSYTSDWDFQDVTQPDSVQIYIYLSPEKFDQVMTLVKLPVATSGAVRLKGVSGFYSEWSPSIRTDRIKILANSKDQGLQNPEQLAFDPPALGYVQEFQISFRQDLPLTVNRAAPPPL
ncbi:MULTISPECIES: hypothetical protein [Bradyrhizobium]|uniref:hypothetical protein n=1 Tax=Bradyrhizobium elkanii TaxID=29448 RepID=UPI00048095D3|nr:hypothetical protein [Bradyrhizobium elkanii]